MAIGPRLELRQTQNLVMTPQLRQAIKLLQFSNFEVAAFIEEELERNPLLERDERIDIPPERPALDQRVDDRTAASAEPVPTDLLVSGDTLPSDQQAPLDNDHAEQFDDGPYDGGYQDDGGGTDRSDWGMGRGASSAGNPEGLDGVAQLVAHARTLREHLSEQLRLAFDDPAERLIGAHLIALLDGAGRVLVGDAALAQALGTSEELVTSVRARMMRFDPAGIFAFDLKGCLAAQLADRNRLDPAMVALLDNLELLGRRELRRLQAVCEVDAEDLAEMIAEIKALDPKPGASFDVTPALPIVPDVLMRAAPGGDWLLELNPDTMPRLLVSEAFHAKVLLRSPKEDRAFLSEKLASANWLVKSLHQRAQTILKVSSEVMRQQEAFLRRGVGHLRPLILRDIAEAVEMHESTVSRVTANKYISTPRGLFELKYFFTAAISGTAGGESHSAEAVRYRIRGMVAAETLQTILSDDAIVAALRREGVDIARRTVAKYRDALRIPSSVQRKRDKSLPA
ncbi:RNA polymerase factor sigma-54 [Lichenicola cladoniae]|uniref:RNA polymerase sigma-54 factor n=1 Tax=Lichenicola cladoniae TaxID=1484109 RepID=A0A6M8HQ19_9PROT|nr:RNA polymerase factor sigma-54 [Lichenicola cladoniae]NPD66435.1 RNA polymerase factor sigma-54 [Acetobacteraceae bacterium]QKE90331.1 RNA polymerase factor sigma-54 [Lichenicola cladoniae]